LKQIHTQVAIIGAGPAGLTLAHWLKTYGIQSIIIERKSRAYVESRVRAGLLEQNTVDIFKSLGLADRLIKEGKEHHGVNFSFNGERLHIPFDELTGGRHITIYGQQEVIKDLTDNWLKDNETLFFEAPAIRLDGLESTSPVIHFTFQDEEYALHCDFIAACDGFHGIGREYLPTSMYKEYTHTYPFSWLGILAHVAPSTEELIYAYHENGFALHSLRSDTISRLYLQVSNDDHLEQWSDDKIWNELSIRLKTDGWLLHAGPIFEKTITPMRSFMIDHMQYGRLFLAGDAAHIVPPTGGKGLNLAIADVKHLVDGFVDYYKKNSSSSLDQYSSNVLPRIWRAQDFSNFMTTLFHKQDEHGSFTYQLQKARFDYLKKSVAYRTTIAENYVGMKME
jgi:p-hydroxybenzoate 3-monooxygenase